MLDKFWTLYDHSPLATIFGIMAALAFAIILALFGISRANAADVTLTWTHPTAFTDGTPLTPAMLANTRIEFGSCAGAAFGTKTGEVNLAPSFLTTTITGLAPGTWCFRAYSKTTALYGGLESAPTGVVSKVIPFPAPNPPVLAVPLIAGMLQTPVYSVASTGKMSTFVGFADVGAQCNGPVLFTYRSKSFREVPRTAVKLWGSTTLRLAAPCA